MAEQQHVPKVTLLVRRRRRHRRGFLEGKQFSLEGCSCPCPV